MENLEEELSNLLINDNDGSPPSLNSSNSSVNSSLFGLKTLQTSAELRDIKRQLMLTRPPTNVLVIENITRELSGSIQTIMEQVDECQLPCIVRYLSIFSSLLFVFHHKNQAQLCKLLVESQPFIKLDNVVIYYGKELPPHSFYKYQLQPPFPDKQFLISPPLSPPNEWEPEGDGYEQPPTDIDLLPNQNNNYLINNISSNNNNTNSNNNNNNNNNSMGVDPEHLTEKLKTVIYQDQTKNGFPSITLEFCT
ncbi:modulatory calcineurin-interacting protein [Tieghemostelium lacteum]|uniref:Modulatory calcineurin-interacting protein n=1 Tax=Tieghemostelium lacteum TaxID=361077 RepID=A0A152A310_TIELA|nr:modulatory calcineurin-interacting protein [Tieghemostelium lacteum]|eukprot:KYR00652.1 modulatory calcineurin-interacting protein [Tieghemostelium lacteum]